MADMVAQTGGEVGGFDGGSDSPQTPVSPGKPEDMAFDAEVDDGLTNEDEPEGDEQDTGTGRSTEPEEKVDEQKDAQQSEARKYQAIADRAFRQMQAQEARYQQETDYLRSQLAESQGHLRQLVDMVRQSQQVHEDPSEMDPTVALARQFDSKMQQQAEEIQRLREALTNQQESTYDQALRQAESQTAHLAASMLEKAVPEWLKGQDRTRIVAPMWAMIREQASAMLRSGRDVEHAWLQGLVNSLTEGLRYGFDSGRRSTQVSDARRSTAARQGTIPAPSGGPQNMQPSLRAATDVSDWRAQKLREMGVIK